MYLIDDILVSAEIFSRKFACRLDACRGACCWEGDFGAPLNEEEERTIREIFFFISDFLTDEARQRINDEGLISLHPETGKSVTPLLPGGACVFLRRNAEGIGQCAFEIAFEAGCSKFIKPISCHLYPIRISQNTTTGFEAINYDDWDICQAACSRGEDLNMPIFRFVRKALIRRYGEDFYKKLEKAYADHYQNTKG